VLIYQNQAINLQVFHESADGRWSEAGRITLPPACPATLDDLRQGKFNLVPPAEHWNDIDVGGSRLRLRDEDPERAYPKCPGRK